MQSKLTILLLSACIVLFSQVQAACVCDASDTVCLQKCVNEGQSCVTACNGETNCYNECIANFWPGQSVASSTAASVAPATTSASATVLATTIVPSGSSAAATATSVAAVSSVVPVASSVAPVVPVVSSVKPVVSSSVAADSHSASFTPTPPTSSSAPSAPPAASSGQSTFLVPAVAIGVASVTVITQFFFLARMGSVLFN